MLSFESDGAQHFPGAARGFVPALRRAFANVPLERAGTRLRSLDFAPGLFASSGEIGSLAASILGKSARPVRAIYFDKSGQSNWALDWHQDRVIAVRERRDLPGFSAWTMKAGMIHVSPPQDLLAQMVTMRVHLDDVELENAPLLIAPGSHKLGRTDESAISQIVAESGSFACIADAGDVWLYSTPILHASARASRPSRRRVLQLDYASFDLPSGLEWALTL